MDRFYLDNFPKIVLERQNRVYRKWITLSDITIYKTDNWLSILANSIIWDVKPIASYIIWGYDEDRIIERWIRFYQLPRIARHILEKANQILWYKW